MEIREATAADYARLAHNMIRYQGKSWHVGASFAKKSLGAAQVRSSTSEKQKLQKPSANSDAQNAQPNSGAKDRKIATCTSSVKDFQNDMLANARIEEPSTGDEQMREWPDAELGFAEKMGLPQERSCR